MERGYAFEHDYGCGFGIISHHADGHHFIGHGGSTVGFRAIMLTDQTEGLGVTILCNGSGVDTYEPARYALQVAAALRDGSPVPGPPDTPDPTAVADAGRYAGAYLRAADGHRLSVRPAGQRLQLAFEGGDCILERISGDVFCAPHDDLDPFPLRFRTADANGADQMAEIAHGPDIYVREGNATSGAADVPPPEWLAFPGHYRSHSPYVSNFRVIVRRGRLYLAWPNGGEEALTPTDPHAGPSGWFKVGPPDRPSAECVRFDPVVGNRALRVIWTGGGGLYRVD